MTDSKSSASVREKNHDTDYQSQNCGTCIHNDCGECRKNPPTVIEASIGGVSVFAYPLVGSNTPACSYYLAEVGHE